MAKKADDGDDRPGKIRTSLPGRAANARVRWPARRESPPAWLTFDVPPRRGDRLVWYLDRIRAWMVHSLTEDLAAGHGLYWCVIAFAVGEVVYLGLPQEPDFRFVSGLAISLTVVSLALHRHGQGRFGLNLTVMACLGCWAGQWQAIQSVGRSLDHERTLKVTGIVAAQETVLHKATRVTLQVIDMQSRGLKADAVPQSVTVTLRPSAPKLKVGDGVRLLATLRPLPGPVLPGGYDFARRAFFDGRGATGFALGKVEKVELQQPPLSGRVKAWIADLRHAIAGRITAALPGAPGAIAAAMIVGEQRGIPDAENDALRTSGLSHIISISGLHMSLVASGVFLATRLLLASMPLIPLLYPIKKIAAAAGLLAASAYMLLAGDAVAAERSYIMCAIMLGATMLDRPAMTLRNVALSAILLLVRDPSQAVEPSFLMSYLAVTSLIAAYDAWRSFRAGRPRNQTEEAGPILRLINNLIARSITAMISSLIATVATASVIADQFFRISPYGVFSNLIVLPAIDLIAMPAAILACIVMPFGLEIYPLTVMGWAIEYMTAVAFKTAELPGGQGLIGQINAWSNPIAVGGLLWLCLWRENWRYLGAVPLCAALAVAPVVNRPDILIGVAASPIAVRSSEGNLKILDARTNKFTVSNWLAADAAPNTPLDPRAPVDPAIGDGWKCDGLGCTFEFKSPRIQRPMKVAVVKHALAFEEDCEIADIVISRLTAPEWCADTAFVIDLPVLTAKGNLALYLHPGDSAASESNRTAPSMAGPVDIQVVGSLPRFSRPWHRVDAKEKPPRPTIGQRSIAGQPEPAAVEPIAPAQPVLDRPAGSQRVFPKSNRLQSLSATPRLDRKDPIEDVPGSYDSDKADPEAAPVESPTIPGVTADP